MCPKAGADQSTAQRTLLWPDSFVARLEALALLQTLNSELLSHDSATVTLEHWCDAHRLASPARIVAERVHGGDKPPSAPLREDLSVGPTEPVRYRRVRLLCGTLVLSEADNWYVPGRLTPEMNKMLDATDIPFGRVVQPLHFRRHTLSSKLLWSPLPDGWEMQTSARDGALALAVPPQLLEHRAVLTLQNGTPFSEVVETYTDNVLRFPSAPRDAPGPPPERGQLLGSWRLLAIEYRGPGGETVDPFYQAGSSGILIYDPSGWMSVQIGSPDRRGSEIPGVRVPRDSQGEREKAQGFDTYYSYYGTWDYDPGTSIVTHHVQGSLIPAEAGMSYAQSAALQGSHLILAVRTGDPGSETLRRKVWEKLPPP